MYEEYEKLIYENITDYKIFHSVDDREYWDDIKKVTYDTLLKEKEYFDNVVFEPLYASMYMEFVTKNNRDNYEKKYFERRRALNVYALLEAVENQGRYLEKILDITWMILEETQWAIPAHAKMREGADALTYYKNHTLCLFSGNTGETLAMVYTLFKDKFDDMSRHISIRIKEEVLERVVYEYLNRDYGFMGLMPTARGTCNWTSTVNAAVLAAGITLIDDKKILAKLAAKVMASTIQQISNYPEDGACNEGSSYWLGGTFDLALVLKYLKNLTGGIVDYTRNDKMIGLSEYFPAVYIYDSYVANFADSDPKLKGFTLCYEIGKIFGNEKLLSIVNDAYIRSGRNGAYSTVLSTRTCISVAECYAELLKSPDIPQYSPQKDNYIKSIQVMSAHQTETVKEGLFMAAKGGNNGEFHNHNDVGTFIVYKNGERFICDAGRKTYNALTFSDKRYEMWQNRSMYHNLPVINGCEEFAGDKYNDIYTVGKDHFAENVVYETDGKTVKFALDINNCYKNREDINKWRRSFVFDREKGEIEVTEEYDLKKCESIVLTYLSAAPFTIVDDGIVMTAKSGETLKMYVDTSLFEIETDEPDMSDDELIRSMWENGLYHIQMKLKNPKSTGKIEYVIK